MEHCKRRVSGTAAKQILQSQLLTITKVQIITTLELLKLLILLLEAVHGVCGSIDDRDGVLLDSSSSFYDDLGTY